LYTLLVASPGVSLDRAFSIALILLGIVIILNVLACVVRAYYRKKMVW